MMKRFMTSFLFLLLLPLIAHGEEEPLLEAPTEMIDEFLSESERFNKESEEARMEAKRIVSEVYHEREKTINDAFERSIVQAENEQRDERNKAIDRFEKFLAKYPADRKYTPDAMFRLSELYYERSYDNYLIENDAYETAIAKGQELPAPVKHYEDTIALMQKLIKEYPDYRLLDGCYYLLAYCLSEQMEDDRAVKIYEELVALLPESRFIPEVLTRIGEYYFENNNLEKALSAYSRVMDYPESTMYDKALYKLAWTHYRMADTETNAFHYDAAVDNFIKLIDFAAEQEEKGTGRGSELRPEAIQYVAISFAEEEWGSLKKLIDYFSSIGDRAYAREVYYALGDIYYDQTKYPNAIEVYEYIQAHYPLDPESPVVQDKIVKAYEKQRDFEAATKAREVLVKNYSPGSEWYNKHRYNDPVIRKAEELTSMSLLSAAQFHHNQAQAFKEAGQLELASQEYGLAADSYGEYLERFPSDRQLYELKFYYADCLYYSFKYLQAADLFSWVRDSDNDTKFLEPAALSAVLAYENELKLEEIKGEREPLKVVTSTDRPVGAKIVPKKLDTIYKKLIKSSDIYVRKVKDSESAATTEYNAAQIFFAHDRFPEARKRFWRVIDNYPDHKVAEFAANLLIESYMIEEKWVLVESTVDEILKRNLTAVSATYKDELKKYKVGAIFMHALELDSAGQYDEAAEEYLRLVGDMKGNEYEDRALNNAAIAYEKANRFETATRMYERLYKEYPKSPLADNAVFRVGWNSERFFDFEGAIAANMNLVNNYPKSPKRADALYNAAITMENTQQYKRAIQHYEMYCKLFKDREDAADAYYRVAELYEKIGDMKKVVTSYQDFIKRYSRTPDQGKRIVQAHLGLALAYKKLKQPDKYKKELQLVISSFAKLTEKEAAVAFAAQAQFLLVELDRPAYEAMKITGTGDQQKNILLKKAKVRGELEKRYNQVLEYKHLEWALAAMVTIGILRQNMVDTIVGAECPTDFKKLARQSGMDVEELCIEYAANLQETLATPGLEMAVAAFLGVLERAREYKVANKWTKEAQVRLNYLSPEEYPLEKEPKSLTYFDPMNIDTGIIMANGETQSLGLMLQEGRAEAAEKARKEEEAKAAAEAAAEEEAAREAAEAAAREAAQEIAQEKQAAEEGAAAQDSQEPAPAQAEAAPMAPVPAPPPAAETEPPVAADVPAESAPEPPAEETQQEEPPPAENKNSNPQPFIPGAPDPMAGSGSSAGAPAPVAPPPAESDSSSGGANGDAYEPSYLDSLVIQ